MHRLRRILTTAFLGGAVALWAPETPGGPALREPVEQVIVVGGGPAGYTAGLFAARAGLEPLVIEGADRGGQPMEAPRVENYPGHPDGVAGPVLMAAFRRQAERFGARFLAQDATALQAGAAGSPHRVTAGGRTLAARTVILAMGARSRRLGVPGETELAGRGVAFSTRDAQGFKDQDVVVVGGGDAALEEALALARSAARVTVVHRRTTFRASRILLDRARAAPNLRWRVPCAVQAFQAGPGGGLAKVVLRDLVTGETGEVAAQGAVVAIGQTPRSELLRGIVRLDAQGYVLTEPGSTRTGIPGLFAAGELADRTYRQTVTAASYGCMAAMDAERYLAEADAAAAPPRSKL
jgi:thioredoxin reductase (NADPH)